MINSRCMPVRAVHAPCTARINRSHSDLLFSEAFVWLSTIVYLERLFESRLNNTKALEDQIATRR